MLSVVFHGFCLCHRFFFRSGNIEHPEDKLFNTTVEVLPFDVSVLLRTEVGVEWEGKEVWEKETAERCQENLPKSAFRRCWHPDGGHPWCDATSGAGMGLPPEELSLPAEGCPDGWDGCRRKNRGQDGAAEAAANILLHVANQWVAWCQVRGRGAMECCDLKMAKSVARTALGFLLLLVALGCLLPPALSRALLSIPQSLQSDKETLQEGRGAAVKYRRTSDGYIQIGTAGGGVENVHPLCSSSSDSRPLFV